MSRLPDRSCARKPRATNVSIVLFRRALASPGSSSTTFTPSILGSTRMVTDTVKSSVFASNCGLISTTSPIGTPRNSTGAPCESPRIDCRKTST